MVRGCMLSSKMTWNRAPFSTPSQNCHVLVTIVLQEKEIEIISKIYKRKEELMVSLFHRRHTGLHRISQIIWKHEPPWNKWCIARSSSTSLIYKSQFSSYALVMGILIWRAKYRLQQYQKMKHVHTHTPTHMHTHIHTRYISEKWTLLNNEILQIQTESYPYIHLGSKLSLII